MWGQPPSAVRRTPVRPLCRSTNSPPMYHVPVHSLAERVLSHIRRQELLRAGDRVGVAVSGGIDSVALLRLLFELRRELGIVLSVVHFNHRLRGTESDADEQFVADLARAHDLEFYGDGDDVAQHAAEDAHQRRNGRPRVAVWIFSSSPRRRAGGRPPGAGAQFRFDG